MEVDEFETVVARLAHVAGLAAHKGEYCADAVILLADILATCG